jgi:ribosomal protein S8E
VIAVAHYFVFSGITRESVHKRRATSGKQKEWRKKRKFQIGRPPAMTHLGGKRIHPVRCRGGLIKHRALRLEGGNFSWGTEGLPFCACFSFLNLFVMHLTVSVSTKPTRIINVVYNASNNVCCFFLLFLSHSCIFVSLAFPHAFFVSRWSRHVLCRNLCA